ncbi:hypothetical protein H5410_056490 [Solanum commersonii]|uniref:Uncharacterized protein n=1 Tax=Solanum commersonii TaxID=4109 RepID=A0A9J5WME3_SOLCO|nr:hypothetical protein H5410_056490 [Solanum commersonii]
MDVHENFRKNDIGVYPLRGSSDLANGAYSIQKLAKRGIYKLWGSFDLEYGLVCQLGPIDCTANLLMDVHKIFWHK